MRRYALPLLILAALVVPAGAQVMRVSPQAVQKVQPPVAVRNDAATRVDPASSPDLARAEIDRLNARNRELRDRYARSLADLQQLRITLDEMTRTGGTLVTAHCSAPNISTNTAGASEDCSLSGYACAEVSGLCHRSCQTTDMCAPGFLCDTSTDHCVPQPS